MATLHLRNVPPHLHERLREAARRDRRSVNAEAVELLVKALGEGDRTSVPQLLEQARRIRAEAPRRRRGPASLAELRAGRRERER